MWVCGLKQNEEQVRLFARAVAPYVGVWIETLTFGVGNLRRCSRTLCGCVD